MIDDLNVELARVTHLKNSFVNDLSKLGHLVTDKQKIINKFEDQIHEAKLREEDLE